MRTPNRRWLLLLALLLVAGGCNGKRHAGTQTLTGYESFTTQRMAVMPFVATQPLASGAEGLRPPLDCTLEQLCEAVNLAITPGAETVMARAFQDALAPRLGDRLVPLEQSARLFQGMPLDRSRDTLRSLAERFGAAVGADHVLVGAVWRFHERAQEDGASVGFAAYCVEVANGRRIWRAHFELTQQSLTADLRDARVFFKGGARWLSAEELTRYGVAQVMEDFPRTLP